MLAYISGMITMGYIVAGFFFLRFWRKTHDTLFGVFAVAFFLLATNQAMTAVSGLPREEQSWIYLLRLAAFILIIFAIVSKNFRSRSKRG